MLGRGGQVNFSTATWWINSYPRPITLHIPVICCECFTLTFALLPICTLRILLTPRCPHYAFVFCLPLCQTYSKQPPFEVKWLVSQEVDCTDKRATKSTYLSTHHLYIASMSVFLKGGHFIHVWSHLTRLILYSAIRFHFKDICMLSRKYIHNTNSDVFTIISTRTNPSF